jgi:hypothetical protein
VLQKGSEILSARVLLLQLVLESTKKFVTGQNVTNQPGSKNREAFFFRERILLQGDRHDG